MHRSAAVKKLLSVVFCCCLCCLGLATAQAAPSNKIAAVVNGRMISMFDVEEAARPELIRKKGEDPVKVRRDVLDEMILDMLLAQEAERLQISVSDAEVEQELLGMMKMRNKSREAFARQLSKEGLTPSSLRTRIKAGLLRQRLLSRQVGRSVVVSPEEIHAYYEAHRSSFVSGGGVNIGLLIYPPREKAEKWAADIRSGKVSFDDAVSRVSIGPNRENGGRVGVPESKMSPGLRKAVASMREGDVSGIFMMDGHKAQFKLYGVAPGGQQLSLEEATPQIDALLREPKARERYDDYIGQLRSRAVIDIRM